MRVLIDSTGLPWASHYYKMFPFEPSRKPEDDILLSPAKVEHLKHPTLLTVMKSMMAAADEGDKEIMVVAHGDDNGLIMHIAPALPLSAGVSILKWLPVAADFFDLVDNSAQTASNKGLLTAWARVAAQFDTQADEKLVDAATDKRVNELLSESKGDVAKAIDLARTRISHQVLKAKDGLIHSLKTTEKALREVADLTSRVRHAGFTRIELRACNIGAGAGIQALRTFFQADRLTAPVVHTFYVAVNAPDNDARHLEHAAAKAGPRYRLFYGNPTAVPLEKSKLPPYVKPFFDPPQAFIPGSLGFMLSVTRIKTPLYKSEARRLNASVIQPWVTKYIHWTAKYTGGAFWVGGLDGPTPEGEPYTLPQEPNYRKLIAVATPMGIDR